MSQTRSTPDCIFIQGITPRCGTNYLKRLMSMHPNCHPGGFIHEDYLLDRAGKLLEYCRGNLNNYNRRWNVQQKMPDARSMLECIGAGLTEYLCQQKKYARPGQGNVLITKTPSVKNIEYFFDLFSDAGLVILVRDGRCTAQSAVKTFSTDYESAFHQWRDGAGAIINFLNKNKNRSGYLLIRYEDLFQNTEQQLRRIFEKFGLDQNAYDYSLAEQTGVIASSRQAQEQGKVSWDGEKSHKNFDPLKRYRNWPASRHSRFNHLAADLMQFFGYDLEQPSPTPVRSVCNITMDFFWYLRRKWKNFGPRKFFWKSLAALTGRREGRYV